MIAYLDSSVLARVYLADEDGHQEATALLADPEIATVTGTWTRIEVSGALVRAARTGRADEKGLLAALDADLVQKVTVLGAPQDPVEEHALELVRQHALRAMDAWHLAVAALVVPPLLEPGEQRGFASRDTAQRRVAELLGFVAI
ncbi:type II toxin-antitoxin system VapC family toxin [[Mycobacterium] crassicus]|uniref:Type II toxin-antitoxin system VapC family toxin n=1 Tax=[Mycobacterium] crassicus TaxID=2872309 RepID=A0ABU5XGP9_9MYCO|nr:type II toxin-antitoxin system VapC family toxin [Mycolicibacter sp. MYC098]MEB3021465.1 type II toxin-antitoxin system VapC family toxin [Mycolicibacter sp. MYC098]